MLPKLLLLLTLLHLAAALPFSIYPISLGALFPRAEPAPPAPGINQCAKDTIFDAPSGKCIKAPSSSPPPSPVNNKAMTTCPADQVFDLNKQTCVPATGLKYKLRMPCIGSDKKYDHMARKCISAATYSQKYPVQKDAANPMTSCAQGLYFDHAQRKCVPYAGKYTKDGRRAYACRSTLRWDDVQQRCVSRLNSKKVGLGKNACPAGMHIDDKLQPPRCVVGEKETGCAKGFRYVKEQKGCVRVYEPKSQAACAASEKWDEGQKKCVNAGCKAEERWDEGGKKCVVKEQKEQKVQTQQQQCKETERWDEGAKKCVAKAVQRRAVEDAAVEDGQQQEGQYARRDFVDEDTPVERRDVVVDTVEQDAPEQYQRRDLDDGAELERRDLVDKDMPVERRDVAVDGVEQDAGAQPEYQRRDVVQDGYVEQEAGSEYQRRDVVQDGYYVEDGASENAEVVQKREMYDEAVDGEGYVQE